MLVTPILMLPGMVKVSLQPLSSKLQASSRDSLIRIDSGSVGATMIQDPAFQDSSENQQSLFALLMFPLPR